MKPFEDWVMQPITPAPEEESEPEEAEEEVECCCGRKYGAPNFEDRYYCGSQWCMP